MLNRAFREMACGVLAEPVVDRDGFRAFAPSLGAVQIVDSDEDCMLAGFTVDRRAVVQQDRSSLCVEEIRTHGSASLIRSTALVADGRDVQAVGDVFHWVMGIAPRPVRRSRWMEPGVMPRGLN